MTKLTQEQRILDHLKHGYRLTPLEALSLFGSLRLGAVIFSLKRKGISIDSQMVEVSGSKHVKQYWLSSPAVERAREERGRGGLAPAPQGDLFGQKKVSQHGFAV